MNKRSKPMPSKEEILAALKKHTNQEAANVFNVGYKTFARWLRHYDINRLFDKDMVSLAKAAAELDVSRMALSNWFRQGKLVGAEKLNNTRVMIPRTTVDQLKKTRNTNVG